MKFASSDGCTNLTALGYPDSAAQSSKPSCSADGSTALETFYSTDDCSGTPLYEGQMGPDCQCFAEQRSESADECADATMMEKVTVSEMGGRIGGGLPQNWRPHEHSFAVLYIEHQWRPNFGEITNACLHDAWQPLFKCHDATSLRPSSSPCPSHALLSPASVSS